MRCTQNYFCYCDLQTPERQQQVLKRELKGTKDKLVGFKTIKKNGIGPYVTKSNNAFDEVLGTLYKVSYRDIFDLDEYEQQFDTKRIQTELESGAMAWVYIDN